MNVDFDSVIVGEEGTGKDIPRHKIIANGRQFYLELFYRVEGPRDREHKVLHGLMWNQEENSTLSDVVIRAGWVQFTRPLDDGTRQFYRGIFTGSNPRYPQIIGIFTQENTPGVYLWGGKVWRLPHPSDLVGQPAFLAQPEQQPPLPFETQFKPMLDGQPAFAMAHGTGLLIWLVQNPANAPWLGTIQHDDQLAVLEDVDVGSVWGRSWVRFTATLGDGSRQFY